MSRKLLTITPSILSAAREYLALEKAGQLRGVHIADCFPVRPDNIIRIWDDALFDLRRRGDQHEFELASVTVFKNGNVAAEYHNLRDPGGKLSLFADLD